MTWDSFRRVLILRARREPVFLYVEWGRSWAAGSGAQMEYNFKQSGGLPLDQRARHLLGSQFIGE